MALRFSRLTRPNIRALKPGEKITEHGVTAEREPDGDIRYSVNIMVEGRRIHRVVGRDSDKTTRTQAEDYIARVKSGAKAGKLDLPKGRKIPLTVSKAADLYLEDMQTTGGKNLTAKEQHIDLHIKPYCGKMELGRVSVFTLQKFRKTILDKGRSVATANRVAATWNHMAGWLFDNGKIGTPLPRMKTKKEDNRRDFIFSPGAEAAILEAAAKDMSPRVWLFMKMGFGTSMRHREILSGRFDNLDVERRRLRIKVKGGRWREQPLPADLAETLRKERDSADDPKGWIFPSSQTKTGHATTMRLAFRRCAIAAKLDPDRATPHAMRHTAVTRFSAAVGGDAAMVQRFSGHQSLAMLLRYTQPADERVDAMLDSMHENPKEASVIKHPKAMKG